MDINLEEAIVLYSRALARRYGHSAIEYASRQAQLMGDNGDHEGFVVWTDVAKAAESILRPSQGGAAEQASD